MKWTFQSSENAAPQADAFPAGTVAGRNNLLSIVAGELQTAEATLVSKD